MLKYAVAAPMHKPVNTRLTSRASVVAATVSLLAAGAVGAGAAEAAAPTYEAGLVTVCAADGFIRVAGVNDGPLPVTITAQERRKGKPVDLLGPNASDELRAIFPLVIPAQTSGAVMWDLPIPAHLGGVERDGNERSAHGSWLPKRWQDENGLDYKGTTGDGVPNGVECLPDEPPPPVDPVPIAPAALYSTSNSQLAAQAHDGDPATEFVTQMSPSAPPTWAWLNADLGETVPLATIEWMWSEAGAADAVGIQVTTDGIEWTTVAEPGATAPGTWSSVAVDRDVRIVRFRFGNPNLDPQLGHLAELRFSARPGFVPTETPSVLDLAEITSKAELEASPTTEPSLISGRYRIQKSMRSSNSPANSSKLAIDRKSATAWSTEMTVAPRTGWVAFDLGDTAPIGRIRYKFSELGFADRFVIQTAPDGIHWTMVATGGNATTANRWVSRTMSVEARYVRFLFTNPNGDAQLGMLSEVRIYPS